MSYSSKKISAKTEFVCLMSLSWQDRGPKRYPRAIYSHRADPRFTWCMHVPKGFADAPNDYRLVVVIHGSSRNMTALRDGFAAHADRHKWVVLVPLFPIGVLGDGNPNGYKTLVEGDIRYDRLLLAMITEFESVMERRFDTFGLFGFSGGGQFANRFLYLHPNRLWAVTVGAPGAVTLIDDRFDYWLGTRDLETVFAVSLDIAQIRHVKIQLLCGDQDVSELKIPASVAEKLKAVSNLIGDIGRNRIERVKLLLANYEKHGLNVCLILVPGVGHDGIRCIDAAALFLSAVTS